MRMFTDMHTDAAPDTKVYATIPAGSVEYDKDAAVVSIDDLIAALEEARESGASHVLGLSGNYRGAQYVRLGVGRIEVGYDDEL